VVGLPGEVYVDSWFPEYVYKASFSADTGHTFRHVYVTEKNAFDVYNRFGGNQLLFMSDREPGVFYILHLKDVNDSNPAGWHLQLCIEYYRDYGATLVDTYCHDIHKDYEIETCETVTDLSSEKPAPNSVLLSWSKPESSLPVEGYRVFRNHHLITENIVTETLYLDENLSSGSYEYNVLVYYLGGCISEISNFVSEYIAPPTCKPVTDLSSEEPTPNSVLLRWSKPEDQFSVKGYSIYRNEQALTDTLVIGNSYTDNNLMNGHYEYYVITHYSNDCVSDSSNHVKVKIGVGVKETKGPDRIVLLPNPTTGELRVTSDGLQITSVEVFDIYGRKLSEQNAENGMQQANFQANGVVFNISHLPNGLYFVKILTGQGVVMRKVVKY